MSRRKKKLELIIKDTCEDCIYSQYDIDKDYYWNCKHPDNKVDYIVDDWKKNGWPPIPDNCPLDDVDE